MQISQIWFIQLRLNGELIKIAPIFWNPSMEAHSFSFENKSGECERGGYFALRLEK